MGRRLLGSDGQVEVRALVGRCAGRVAAQPRPKGVGGWWLRLAKTATSTPQKSSIPPRSQTADGERRLRGIPKIIIPDWPLPKLVAHGAEPEGSHREVVDLRQSASYNTTPHVRAPVRPA
ncbi:hypothetical protein GCM10023084_60660 [Streptomyces lacrimifluminis]|uniref:Uncharacterized protein n=1 Tax=Streptomyces lacrimifluminis TaxID=1500077 RepID=A0A917KYA4_9ACTN|nr:hypothetical protein GCM10012282_32030 [Streptomyces lacrimifluminis]